MNPLALFLVAVAALVALLVILCLSIWYYWRAKDLAPHLAKLKSVKEEIATAQDSAARENQRVKDLQNERALAERSIADGNAARQWLDENRGRVEALRSEIDKLTADAKKAEQIYNERQGELTERQQQIATLASESSATEAKIAGQKTMLESLRSDQTRLESRVSDLEKQKSGLDGTIADLDAKRQSAERLLEDLQRKIREAREKQLDIDSRISAGEAALATQRTESAKVLGEADAARRILTDLEKTREIGNEKWRNLDLPVVQDSGRGFADSFDQEDWLRRFSISLHDHGFIFDDRAIRAFHTGLLCGQTTPLVVLAGISGTGKSLLPELYASALGMNFLSVPVQPRWDGPQDLFGFYNYMEGRYKATELARLLWQFDAYNNPAASNLPNLPISLVLLDEMNLARVEYYFSDLLSKLELRNGLDPSIDAQRRRAEIELECNASGQLDLVRRLFVSRNVLFVGTMNEDESTQTLSDKVIDRANVLRFGRPATLSAKPRKDKFLEGWNNSKRIDAKTWARWSVQPTDVPDTDERISFLSEVLTPVADALDRVGRPYGFRVDLAMKAYIANYPGPKEHAVADQIEMKILPKLNGLELDMDGFDGAKQALLDAIDRTRDARLKSAFEKSCPRGATFFKWRGVAR